MQTTTTTPRTIGMFGIVGWTRTLLLAAAVVVLAASAPQPVGASQDSSDKGTNQVLACRMMGGTPEVYVERTAGGIEFVSVRCEIPGLGGWWCINDRLNGTRCDAIPIKFAVAPSKWTAGLTGKVLPALETGSVTRIESAIGALQADGIIQAEMRRSKDSSATDRDGHDTPDKSSKSSKHGKKGKHDQHGKNRGERQGASRHR